MVEDSANPDSTPFVINAVGATILGYTATIATQNYAGIALANTQFQLHGAAGSTAAAAVFNWASSASSPASFIFNKSISNTIGTRGALTATNTDIGALSFNGDDGTNFIPAAAILAEVDGTPGTNDMPGRLIFSTTADGASTPTERMRIASNGDVSLAGGTANAVAFLNGSKVLTTGTALTFDGTNVTNTGGVFISKAPGAGFYGQSDVGASTGFLGFNQYTGVTLSSQNTNPIKFEVNSAEQMRLTSTGLGIGTSSPAYKLDIQGVTDTLAKIYRTNTTSGLAFGGDAFGAVIAPITNDNIQFYNAAQSVLRMKLDSSGNLGLGVVPSAWTSYKALSINGIGQNIAASGGAGEIHTTANCYFNSGWKYAATQGAARFSIGEFYNDFRWFTAPSGTAGNAITFTQAMTLDASGNLFVGSTTGGGAGAWRTYFVGGASTTYLETTATSGNTISKMVRSASDGTAIAFSRGGSDVGSVGITTTATTYNTSSDYRLKNITGPITTSGAYIDSLKPVEGTWKADGSTFVGLIAHETQEASRTAVATGTKDGAEMQGMDYSSAEIIANLIAELQSLRKRLAAAGI